MTEDVLYLLTLSTPHDKRHVRIPTMHQMEFTE